MGFFFGEMVHSSLILMTRLPSLRKLKAKLDQQRKHLDELDGHIKELEKQNGGEQH